MVRYAAGAETRRKLVPRFVEGETRPPLLPQCRLPDFFKAVMYGLLEFGFGVGKRRCDPGVSSHCDRNVLNAAAARKSEDSQSASHLFLNIRSCAIGTDRRGGGRRRARRCITAGCPCLAGRRRSLDAHRPHRVSPDHSAARFRIHRVRERVEQAPKNSPKKAFDLPRRLSPAALGPKPYSTTSRMNGTTTGTLPTHVCCLTAKGFCTGPRFLEDSTAWAPFLS
jgi:hypothetical protein